MNRFNIAKSIFTGLSKSKSCPFYPVAITNHTCTHEHEWYETA